MLAKAQLVHGEYYSGKCRNTSIARWNAEAGCFMYWRSKFGMRFLEEIYHPDDDPHYDVFHAVSRVENPSDVIPLSM